MKPRVAGRVPHGRRACDCCRTPGFCLFRRKPGIGFYNAMRDGRPVAPGRSGQLLGVERRKLCAWLERGGKALGPPLFCGLASPKSRPSKAQTRRHDATTAPRYAAAVPTRHAELAAISLQGANLRTERQWHRTTLVVIRFVEDALTGDIVLRGERPCLSCLHAALSHGIGYVVYVDTNGELLRRRTVDMDAVPSVGATWIQELACEG
eukprot:NODE_11699_length_1270_cov_7.208224.p2 GENE.NODE_11699_length_1270_cov_7.208224~~NODE_11699_length_1270_cov_7.208224.p2  ORF type:complete len:208 (-),score=29.91 NODE_11699_length_1270_cov_7.208224:430-1053(-)